VFSFPIAVMGGGFSITFSGSFNGVDEYIQTDVDFSGEPQFTLSGWFYRATQAQRIDIAQTDSSNTNRIKLILNSSGAAVLTVQSSSRTSVVLGTGWFHLVLVYDGSEVSAARTKLYVDGSLEGNTSGTPPTVIPTN